MMGGSIERNGRTYICDGPRTLSVTKTGNGLSTYVFDVLQILGVIHLSLNKLEDDAVQTEQSNFTLNVDRREHPRLALRLLFRDPTPHVLRDQVVPVELSCRSLTHSYLENPQLSNVLEVPHGLDRLFQEIGVRVLLRSLCPDGLKDDRVLLQMLRRAVEPVLKVHFRHVIRVAHAVLQMKHKRVSHG